MRGRNRASSNFFLTSAVRVGIGNANPVQKPKVFELDPRAEACGDPEANSRISISYKKEINNGR